MCRAREVDAKRSSSIAPGSVCFTRRFALTIESVCVTDREDSKFVTCKSNKRIIVNIYFATNSGASV
jgi:hypothetical protein